MSTEREYFFLHVVTDIEILEIFKEVTELDSLIFTGLFFLFFLQMLETLQIKTSVAEE